MPSIVFSIALTLFLIPHALSQSAMASSAPLVDGMITEDEWAGGQNITLSNGELVAKPDGSYIYILIDLPQDTGNGTSQAGDYFWLTFDANRDGKITPNVDVNYGQNPNDGSLGMQYYLAASEWTGLKATSSKLGVGFGPSPNSEIAHRFWELAINRSEINASSINDTVARIGLRVGSVAPSFIEDQPLNFFSDFSNLTEINLPVPDLPSSAKPAPVSPAFPINPSSKPSRTNTTTWGPHTLFQGKFLYPIGITSGLDGSVYVSDTLGNNVQKFDAGGAFLQIWNESNSNEFSSPSGLGIDRKNNAVYVVEQGAGRIQKFDGNGTFLLEWGSPSSSNSALSDGTFSSPLGVAVDSNGYVYVADSGNSRIQKFDDTGKFITKWGAHGSGSGDFDHPTFIAIDRDDNVYVTDSGSALVQKFTSAGVFVSAWNMSSYLVLPPSYPSDMKVLPIAITVDEAGNIYVSTVTATILKFDPDGNLLGKWQAHSTTGPQFGFVSGLTINTRNGELYAVFGTSIQVFSTDGIFHGEWGGRVSTSDQLSDPSGIATDSNNNVYVIDSGNWRIQKFDSEGMIITRWNLTLGSESDPSRPSGIAISRGSDDVFVTDDRHGITRYNSEGKVLNQWHFSETLSPDNRSAYESRVAADRSGNVYVLESGNTFVKKFSSQGQLLLQWTLPKSPNGYFYPTGIATDSVGNVYVADYSFRTVEKFSGTGVPDPEWSTKFSPQISGYFSPYSVAVDPQSGTVFVADVDNHRIQEFSSKGEFLTTIGTEGRGPGQFKDPTVLNVDSTGALYVIDTGANFRIQKFSSDGIFIAKTGDHPPVALAGDDITTPDDTVTYLNGSASYDPDVKRNDLPFKEQITFSWKQISGIPVELSDANSAQLTFRSPILTGNQTVLMFKLTVSDYLGVSSSDTVNVTVRSNQTNLSGQSLKFSILHRLGNTNTNSSTGEVLVKTIDNHVYLAWTEGPTVMIPNKLLFAASIDGGHSFSKPINLGNNSGYVALRQLSLSGSHVYVLWVEQNATDFFSNRLAIAISEDYGQHFSEPIVLSKHAGNTDTCTMETLGSNLYIVWSGGSSTFSQQVADPSLTANTLLLTRSNDYGKSFSPPATVPGSNSEANGRPSLLVGALANQSLILGWSEGYGSNQMYSFVTKSVDGGKTFGKPTSIQGKLESGAAAGNTVAFVVQRYDDVPTGTGYASQDNMFLFQSKDGGLNFDNGTQLTQNTPHNAVMFNDPTVLLPTDHDILIQWTRINTTSYGEEIFVLSSHDGGQTFQTRLVDRYVKQAITDADGQGGSQIQDSSSMPRFTADPTGKVYLVYMAPVSSGEDFHVFLAFSTDGGNTFTKKLQLDSIQGKYALSPRISVTHRLNQSTDSISLAWIGGTSEPGKFWSKSIAQADTYYEMIDLVNTPEFPIKNIQLPLLVASVIGIITLAPRILAGISRVMRFLGQA